MPQREVTAAVEPAVPIEAFKAACYAAARQVGATVRWIRGWTEGGLRSFHAAELALPHGAPAVQILCNPVHAVVAFARAGEDGAELQFVDHPGLAEALGASFTIMHRHQALAPLTDEWRRRMSTEDERYWRPERTGDVAFNWWD
jgi:hypothetical protein